MKQLQQQVTIILPLARKYQLIVTLVITSGRSYMTKGKRRRKTCDNTYLNR